MSKLRRISICRTVFLSVLFIFLLQPCCPIQGRVCAFGVWEGELSALAGEDGLHLYFLNSEWTWFEVVSSAPIDASLYGQRVRITGTCDREANVLVASIVKPVLGAQQPKNPTTGEQKAAVIAVKFSDITSTSHNLNYFQEMVFDKMDNYFREASYNKTFFKGDVFGWYTLPREYSYYVNSTSKKFFRDRLDEVVHDAVAAADRDVYYPEFVRIYLVFNGNLGALGSVGLWTIDTEDGKVKASISWLSEDDPLGIWVHETGHNFGLPDLYDVRGNEEFVGKWDAMAEGAWNHGGLSPAHFTSYGKLKLGWIPREQTVELLMGQDSSISLKALEVANQGCIVIKIYVGGGRYYLVEARMKIGYDLYIPDSGVLVLYVDESIKPENGGVRVIDSTPSTTSLDDATFDSRSGKPRNWLNSTIQLAMVVSGVSGIEYEIHFSYGDSIVIDSTYAGCNRANVESEQVIAFHAIWRKCKLPADIVLKVSGMRIRTNSTGWATCVVTSKEVGLIAYNISSVETPSGIGVSFLQQAHPTIIWDRLAIEWGALKSRIDVGSQATLFGTVRYKYDNKPVNGTISINGTKISVFSGSFTYEPPPISGITKMRYTLDSAYGSDYGISNFEAMPQALDIIYDRVKVVFSTSTPRIEVGRNATVTYAASYEYDNSTFSGRILLNSEEFVQDKIGMICYTVTSIVDEKYGLKTFIAKETFVTFDRIALENEIDALEPGRVRVMLRLLFESDAQPVDGASVTVNGFPAKKISEGVFEAEVDSWSPQFLFTITIERPGFSAKGISISGYAFGNIAIESLAIFFVAFSILLVRRRISRVREQREV